MSSMSIIVVPKGNPIIEFADFIKELPDGRVQCEFVARYVGTEDLVEVSSMTSEDLAEVRSNVALMLELHGKIHAAAPRVAIVNAENCPLVGHSRCHDELVEILSPGYWSMSCPFCGKRIET